MPDRFMRASRIDFDAPKVSMAYREVRIEQKCMLECGDRFIDCTKLSQQRSAKMVPGRAVRVESDCAVDSLLSLIESKRPFLQREPAVADQVNPGVGVPLQCFDRIWIERQRLLK